MQYGHIVRKDYFVVLTLLRFPYVILCPNLITLQTSQEKVPRTHKELIYKIITFKSKKLLLLKSPQNKLHQILLSLEKNKNKSEIDKGTHKVTDFTDEPIVQCDVPAEKNASLNGGNNDDLK